MKRNFLKKLSAAILCGAMLVGCITGCGQEQPVTKESTPVQETTKTSEVTPEVKEPDKITMWSSFGWRDSGVGYEGARFVDIIEEVCNVEIEFVDSVGSTEAMSILIGTNTLPDLVWCGKTEIAGGINQLYIDGGVLAFNDLMDQGLMPNLTNIYENCPQLAKQASTEDGKYIAAGKIDTCEMTGEQPIISYTGGFLIRQDWLDELGLKVPETVQELEEVLVAFKEKKGALGFAASWQGKSNFILSTAFGINQADSFTLDNGVVKYGAYEDVYKDFLTLQHKWMELGIIDPDTYTQDQDTFWSKMATGKYGLVYGFRGGEFNKIHTFENYDQMNWQPIPFMPLEKGESFDFSLISDNLNLYSDNMLLFIPSNSKNPEAAARVIDFLYSEEGTDLLTWGIEGESYEVVNGEKAYTKNITENADGLSLTVALEVYCGEILNSVGVMNKQKDIDRTLAWEEQVTANEAWELNNPGAPTALPTVTLTEAEIEEANAIKTDLDTFVDENRLNFILGTRSLDEFEKYQEEMKEMGVEKLIKIYQAAYDRTLE